MDVSPDSALELLRSGKASRAGKMFLADGLMAMDTMRLLQCLTSLSRDVLRKIGSNREWSRNPSVVTALVGNPKTPLGLSTKIFGRPGVKDLKTVATSRSLPETLRRAAGTLSRARRGSGV